MLLWDPEDALQLLKLARRLLHVACQLAAHSPGGLAGEKQLYLHVACMIQGNLLVLLQKVMAAQLACLGAAAAQAYEGSCQLQQSAALMLLLLPRKLQQGCRQLASLQRLHLHAYDALLDAVNCHAEGGKD
jgi:hypothetical protein